VKEGAVLRFDERVECVWGGLKDCLLQGADEVSGRTKGPQDTKNPGGGMKRLMRWLERSGGYLGR